MNSSSAQNPNLADADLPSAIHLLGDLISTVSANLASLSSFFPSPISPAPTFSQCPFDPRHRMPAECVFRHSLRCPSYSSSSFTTGLVQTLRYPNSFKSEEELEKENHRSDQPMPTAESDELCFSLDRSDLWTGSGSGFFYRDCPGVVSFPESDMSSRHFTLPGVLSAECANFSEGLVDGCRGGFGFIVGIFPSDLWYMKVEVGSWRDFPIKYSMAILRAVLCLDKMDVKEMSKWVISNSLSYGIAIDEPMRDHVFLLLKLCLKAIWREACQTMELYAAKDVGEIPNVKPGLVFPCPCLVRSMVWLGGSQLSILYGEKNGRLFALDMLKEVLLLAGSNLVLSPLKSSVGKEDDHSVRNSIVTDVEFTGRDSNDKGSSNLCLSKVYITQIASAIAALHERSILERRIKELQLNRIIPKYQLLNELAFTTARADELRSQRLNYRALLDYDGLMWHQSHDQVHGKTKSREQILAEERDYKRRRMSYRGKKAKRSHTQVLHDIIDDHMEEIKKAGGIGCNVKDNKDFVRQDIHSVSTNVISEDAMSVHPYKMSIGTDQCSDSSELTGEVNRKNMLDSIPNFRELLLKPHHDHVTEDSHPKFVDNDGIKKEYGRYEYKNQDNEKYKRHDHPYKYKDDGKELSFSSKYPDGKTSTRRKYKSYKSKSEMRSTFEDRYDPSNSDRSADTLESPYRATHVSSKNGSFSRKRHHDH